MGQTFDTVFSDYFTGQGCTSLGSTLVSGQGLTVTRGHVSLGQQGATPGYTAMDDYRGHGGLAITTCIIMSVSGLEFCQADVLL